VLRERGVFLRSLTEDFDSSFNLPERPLREVFQRALRLRASGPIAVNAPLPEGVLSVLFGGKDTRSPQAILSC